jgi:hypothetical protein
MHPFWSLSLWCRALTAAAYGGTGIAAPVLLCRGLISTLACVEVADLIVNRRERKSHA